MPYVRHSPVSVQVLLHHYYSPEPYQPADAPATIQAIDKWEQEGMLQRGERDGTECWLVSRRGEFWIEMLLRTPYPIQVWCDPRTGDRIPADAMVGTTGERP